MRTRLLNRLQSLEDGLRALDVRDQRLHGLLDDQPDADRGGEVEDDVALVDELVDDVVRQDRVDDQVEVRALLEMGHVLRRAGRQVVEREDLPAVGQEQLAQVRADEAGTTRDQRLGPGAASSIRRTAHQTSPSGHASSIGRPHGHTNGSTRSLAGEVA